MRAIAVASCLSGLVACSASSGVDETPPTIEITSPERGTFAQGSEVQVTGFVHDDSPGVIARVNGQDITPAADGSFSATVPVAEGISIIQSFAVDKANNETRDVRAVMAGTLATSDGSQVSPLGARVGAQTFGKLGTALGAMAEGMDWTAIGRAMNPVYNSSGCNSAKIDIESINISNIDVALVPTAGKLGTEVLLSNVVVDMDADFRAVCISGSTSIKVRSSLAHINGDLALAVKAGAIDTTLPAASVQLDGFSIDIGGVPGAIESLIKGEARKAVEKALTNAIKDKVPELANEQLSGLLAKPFAADVLGHPVSLTTSPKEITLSADGLFVAVDTKVKVTGGEGGMYISSPTPMTAALMPTTGIGAAIADDTLNQLFSGLWAAGAIDQDVGLDGNLAVLAALLDDDAASLSISASLPPTVSGDGAALTLSIGDLMIDVKDSGGNQIQQIALSVKTSLQASPTQTGTITLAVGQPELFAQVITQNADVVDRPMTSEQFEGIIGGAWGLVGGQADQALAGLHMPTIGGVTLGAPSLAGNAGYLVADIPVQ
ncbi:MAG: hypothetical protein AB7T06_42715 [Kofleriaceae bacterium]